MMIRKITSRNAQNLIEYAIVIALISGALGLLSTYVFRAVQSQQKMITEASID